MWIWMQYLKFGGCTQNVVIIVVTLLLTVATYILVLPVQGLNFRKDANLFTASLLMTYMMYLLWSALSSNYDTECTGDVGD